MISDRPEEFDIVVVGAGIAGASVAAELAASGRVLLLEREAQPGYHSTGRSAAQFSRCYGPPAIRALSRASAAFLENPPAGFAAAPLLSARSMITVGGTGEEDAIEAAFAEISGHGAVRRVSQAEALEMMPLLRPESVLAGFVEEDGSDIDVHALHHGFLRRFRAAGGRIETGCEVDAVERDGKGFLIATRKGRTFRAGVVVNAAGAWADELGALAGAARTGLSPKRRTAITIAAPGGDAPAHWPMVGDIGETYYMKPDAGRLLASPADATPSPPCDAQPDELDVAICADRIATAFDLTVTRIETSWAGLRSFVADKSPVIGYDPSVEGFFWLAAQGGYGIQTAPAAARAAASLVLRRDLPADIEDEGVSQAALSPARLAAQDKVPA